MTKLQPPPQQNRNKKSLAYYGLASLLITALGFAYFFTRNQPIDSIAVLPFKNADNDPDIEYLSDGITETLITKLSQLPQLRVMARSTAFRYKGKDVTPQQVGEQLNVRAVLMGEIVKRDDVLRLNAELVDVSDGAQIWGEQYNRKMDELFAIEDAISEQISTSLRLKLSSDDKTRLVKRHTENPEAYQLYLKGRFHWNKRSAESLKTALGYFQQAADRDPTYALAYAGIADCYALLPIYSGLSGKEAFPKAKSAALQALQIDEQLAEAYAALSNVANFTWDLETAEKSIVRAIELKPNYASAHQWYSMLLTSHARFSEAIAEMKRALQLDPLSLIINADLGDVYFRARNYDLAIQQLRKTIEMDQNFYFAQYRLGVAYIFKGEISKGMEQLRQAMQLDDDPTMLASMGYGYGISGNTEEAEKTLVLLVEVSSQRVVSPYDYARIYAGLGDKEKAMEYLQRCLEQREWQLLKLNFDPYWDNLRDDSRFVELVKKVGLEK
jgi:TolB-like protein/Flp pilus assembly protein TadD